MTVTTAELRPLLKRLKLGPRLDTLPERIALARRDGLEYAEFLQILLADEVSRRDHERLELRLRQAGFEQPCRIEDFDWSAQVRLDRRLLDAACSLRFLDRREHVLLVGPVGVGNSFLDQALGYAAVRSGRSACFVSADQYFRELAQARVDHSTEKTFRAFLAPDLLILDDLGLHRLSAQQSIDLYELVIGHHRSSSFVITSNRAVEEWLGLFDDPILGNSALDRLANASYQIAIEGGSAKEARQDERRCAAGVPLPPVEEALAPPGSLFRSAEEARQGRAKVRRRGTSSAGGRGSGASWKLVPQCGRGAPGTSEGAPPGYLFRRWKRLWRLLEACSAVRKRRARDERRCAAGVPLPPVEEALAPPGSLFRSAEEARQGRAKVRRRGTSSAGGRGSGASPRGCRRAAGVPLPPVEEALAPPGSLFRSAEEAPQDERRRAAGGPLPPAEEALAPPHAAVGAPPGDLFRRWKRLWRLPTRLSARRRGTSSAGGRGSGASWKLVPQCGRGAPRQAKARRRGTSSAGGRGSGASPRGCRRAAGGPLPPAEEALAPPHAAVGAPPGDLFRRRKRLWRLLEACSAVRKRRPTTSKGAPPGDLFRRWKRLWRLPTRLSARRRGTSSAGGRGSGASWKLVPQCGRGAPRQAKARRRGTSSAGGRGSGASPRGCRRAAGGPLPPAEEALAPPGSLFRSAEEAPHDKQRRAAGGPLPPVEEALAPPHAAVGAPPGDLFRRRKRLWRLLEACSAVRKRRPTTSKGAPPGDLFRRRKRLWRLLEACSAVRKRRPTTSKGAPPGDLFRRWKRLWRLLEACSAVRKRRPTTSKGAPPGDLFRRWKRLWRLPTRLSARRRGTSSAGGRGSGASWKLVPQCGRGAPGRAKTRRRGTSSAGGRGSGASWKLVPQCGRGAPRQAKARRRGTSSAGGRGSGASPRGCRRAAGVPLPPAEEALAPPGSLFRSAEEAPHDKQRRAAGGPLPPAEEALAPPGSLFRSAEEAPHDKQRRAAGGPLPPVEEALAPPHAAVGADRPTPGRRRWRLAGARSTAAAYARDPRGLDLHCAGDRRAGTY